MLQLSSNVEGSLLEVSKRMEFKADNEKIMEINNQGIHGDNLYLGQDIKISATSGGLVVYYIGTGDD